MRIKNGANGLLPKLLAYILVGGSAAAVNWAIFYICLEGGIWYLLAGVISFFIATLWNFFLARRFVFAVSKKASLREGLLVYLVSFFGLIIDLSVLFLCVAILGLAALPSKILATGLAFVFNFGLRYFLIYRD